MCYDNEIDIYCREFNKIQNSWNVLRCKLCKQEITLVIMKSGF